MTARQRVARATSRKALSRSVTSDDFDPPQEVVEESEAEETTEVEVVDDTNYTSEQLSQAAMTALRKSEPLKPGPTWQLDKARVLAQLAVAAALRESNESG